ncbi:MAG: class A beta-lactamase-related serine hydrolase [Acidobacteriia bacterium]|nr:class A beta-lactamase-related serine hydrolase [Terriglobia bacterium]
MKLNSVKAVFVLLSALPALAQNPAAPKPIDLLKQKLEQISASVSADWGIYIKSLDTGEEIAINADKVMDTMSAIKIPLLVDVYRQVDAGKINTTDRFAMKTADKRFGTGVLRTLDSGLNLSFRDALELMIIQSDNSGTDMAFARAGGPAHVTQTMHELGLNSITATGTSFDWFRALAEAGDPSYSKLSPEELFTKGFPDKLTDAQVERFHFEGKHPYGLSSARDMGKLLEMMATNKAASEKSCKEMLRIMGRQQFRTRIPRFLLDDANIPHKTGDFPPYIANDVGLIQTPSARVVVVFFSAHHRGFYSELEDAIGRMSEQVWGYFNYREHKPAVN